ncbi:ATP-binding protein [Plantactinospora soyae]|uniref:Anti-sigma regulatory factor (Ser/Thr protein kinase) n=1 Tax=Plantactinospora soyae TaxID=1544732 RepID=A0A927MIN5_9ACTN|nr:ATP-binding protein [Plantactinospora soyae]MBE1492323.1 anti-sigma regulatory factor (Ser/Thr protein kinase) [Plantactinospora soyae]
MAAHIETGALVITMAGRWSVGQAYALQRAFERCAAHRPPYVAVDCTRIVPDGLVPALLPALVVLGESCRRGITVLVCAPASTLTGLLRRLPTTRIRFYPRLTEALSRVRPYHLPGPSRRVHRRFTPSPGAVGTARRLVRECCERWRLDGVTDNAQLVVSELMANAVEHAGTDIDLTICHHRQHLRIAVADRHHAVPAIDHKGADDGDADPRQEIALRGRGLALVARSVANWGVLRGTDGKVIWAALAAPRATRLRLSDLALLSGSGYPA